MHLTRWFPALLFGLSVLSFSSKRLTPVAPSVPPPNVVFILADDLGWANLGCYGNPYNRTPHLDSLARRGVRFTQAYAAAPVCSPSRVAILTGKHPARLHLTNFLVGERRDSASRLAPARWRKYLPASEVTMAELLRQQGYATGMVGKWHLGGADTLNPTAQGFDYERQIGRNGLDYYRYSITANNRAIFTDTGTVYLTDRLTDYALDFLDQNRQRPFFLYLTYSAPHVTLVPRGDKLNHYLMKYEKYGGKYNPSYGAMIESLDDGVGRVLKKLADLGLRENTLVVFTSDNGGVGLSELGPTPTSNAPLRSWKGHMYEGGIRVPLVMAWPGQLPANTTQTAYLTGTDFLPTLADVLGLTPLPLNLDGKSFYPLLSGKGTYQRGPIFWHYPHFSNQLGRPAAAVRDGDYKLIEHYETGRLELYNLASDLSEQHDLARQLPQKTKELHTRLIQWRKNVNANMPEPNPLVVKRN